LGGLSRVKKSVHDKRICVKNIPIALKAPIRTTDKRKNVWLDTTNPFCMARWCFCKDQKTGNMPFTRGHSLSLKERVERERKQGWKNQ